jgi:tetratricopeptide (TPR) repeat protein
LSELRHDEVLELTRRSVELAPSDAYCVAICGMTQLYAGDFPNAIASLKASLRLSPYGINYVIYYLGFAYLWLGDLDQALAHAARYLEREPQEPFAYFLSAITAAAAGRHHAAKTHAAALLTAHPEMTCADFAHAQYYRDANRLELLVGWLKSAGMPER